MVTKLAAARICLGAGCRMAIAMGKPLNPLAAIERGARCSWFLPQAEPRTARKQWILGSLKPAGTVTVDNGAARALAKGGSLLPAGVTRVEGDFEAGDCVLVAGADGRVLGRGLSAYAAHDATRLCGRKSMDFETVLGYRGKDELIHRDDLVLEG
jgi:glutamate 5-kinase